MTEPLENTGAEPAAGAEDLRAENERLRAEVKRARAASALREALLAAGALPETCGLLAGSVAVEELDSLALDSAGCLADAGAVIDPLRSRYGLLFRRAEEIPAPPLAPPAAGGPALRRDDLRRMSAGEINARWDAVRDALRR